MKRIALLTTLVLFGCSATFEPPAPNLPPLPDPSGDSCGAAEYASLIGQPDTALERVLILRQVRVIRPGLAVTMDYRPDRINFEIDQAGKVQRISCG